MNTKEDILIHDNINWFGRSKTIIYKGGLGVVELLYDNHTPLEARMNRLLVHPSVRGTGIGMELLKLAEETAQEDGKTVLSIFADRSKPEITVLYSQSGFTVIETTEHVYRMIKNIKQRFDENETE